MERYEEIRSRALSGRGATLDEALWLAENISLDRLCDDADEIRRACCDNHIDTCSIINARSGRCSENCKWCAQSRFHATGIEEYDIVPADETLRHCRAAEDQDVERISLVTSGRRIAPDQIDRFCDLYRRMADNHPSLYLCASMGLLGKAELQKLADAGVKRYHCNLETGSDYFPSLCTTHTQDDKLQTIRWAREVGMEICCGGIIGMGETLRDRLRLAEMAIEAGAVSIPVNILQPIKGTPLQDTPLISEDDIAQTIALYRFMAPDKVLRFAGGRARISANGLERMLRGGMNGAMIGDLLTTVGNKADDDRRLFTRLGFTR